MPSFTVRITTAAVVCGLVVFLSSCHTSSTDGPPHTTTHGDEPLITGEPATYNPADITFADKMIPLDEQGIEISRLVPDRSGSRELVAFAAKSAATQQSDIEVLKALRAQWRGSQDTQTTAGQPGAPTPGTFDEATIAKLEPLRGTEFASLWLKSMIGLDQRAGEIANAEITNGKNDDMISMAKRIAEEARADTGQMQQLLAG